jgi:hypothetical protein
MPSLDSSHNADHFQEQDEKKQDFRSGVANQESGIDERCSMKSNGIFPMTKNREKRQPSRQASRTMIAEWHNSQRRFFA